MPSTTLTVDIATGIPANITDPLGFGAEITDVDVLAWTLSATNLNAFVGLNGPYWEDDVDGDNAISWLFDTSDTTLFPDAASRTITGMENASVTIDTLVGATSSTVTVASSTVLNANTIYTLDAADGWIELGGTKYGDIDNDQVVDADEGTELSKDAAGLAVKNLSFGAIFMVPTAALPISALSLSYLPRFHAIKGTAQSVEFVGFDDIALSAPGLTLNVSSGRQWPGEFGPPVVDFAKSFETSPNAGNGSYTVGSTAIDFDGNPRISAAADSVLLQLSEFVHLSGSFSIEKGPRQKVDVATGLPGNLADILSIAGAALKDAVAAIPIEDGAGGTVDETTDLHMSSDFSTIRNLNVTTLQIGTSDASAFVGVPNAILEKPGKLTRDEFAVMKKHTCFAYTVLTSIGGLDQIAEWAAFHHEKLDGSGYPFHVSGERLNTGARIMAVADIFTALAEDRPYRPGMQREDVARIINRMANENAIDRRIVDLLLDNYQEVLVSAKEKQSVAHEEYRRVLALSDTDQSY